MDSTVGIADDDSMLLTSNGGKAFVNDVGNDDTCVNCGDEYDCNEEANNTFWEDDDKDIIGVC